MIFLSDYFVSVFLRVNELFLLTPNFVRDFLEERYFSCDPVVIIFRNLLVNDIYDYAPTRGMRVNSKKCKGMVINFLQYRLIQITIPRCITGW